MSFQAYLTNIEAKTGLKPADFRERAAIKRFCSEQGLAAGVKPGMVMAWLKEEFSLGHGHAMAIVAVLKGKEAGER